MFKFFTPIQVELNGELHDALMTALAHNEANFKHDRDIHKSADAIRKKIERLGSHGIDGYGERYMEMGFTIAEGAALIEQFAAYSHSMIQILRRQNETMQAALDIVKEASGSPIRKVYSREEKQNSGKVGDDFD